jgi:tRNA dimethylallyltransferase
MAIELAKYYRTEIISADSRQFFKEISIGTAKPGIEEQAQVPHHFINSHSIFDDINAGSFERDALTLLEVLFKTHDKVIMVGGSGLYINAVCEGFDELPKGDEDVRSRLNKDFEENGIEPLQIRLKELDPEFYASADLSNSQRVIRALEVCILSGKPFSSFKSNTKKARPFNIVKIGVNLEREELYNRINHRVDLMMEAGLLQEAQEVYLHKNIYALQTVGYTELFDYFDGKHSLERALELIKQNTRRFAKRQLTWFNRDKSTVWFKPDEEAKVINYIDTL